MPSRGRRRQGRLDGRRVAIWRRLRLVVLAVVGVIVVLGLVLAYRALQAKSSLTRAESHARLLNVQVGDSDVAAAKVTLRDLQADAREARSHTDGVLWAAAGHLPVLGPNFTAVKTVSKALDTIAATGIAPVVDVADHLDPASFSPKNGRIDIDAMTKIAPSLATADKVLTASQRAVGQIKTDELFGPLRDPIINAQKTLADARAKVAAGSDAVSVMPAMLGGSEKRTYILVFQNNAEIRATGGLPGAWAEVTAKDGKISLGRQGTAGDFPYSDKPVVDLGSDEIGLYSEIMANFWQDTNFTPDFPRTGQLMRAFYKKSFGTSVDGVISVDPVALSYLIKGTGPITLADGKRLTSDNTVKLLLNDPYLNIATNELQNAYFADAAQRVFEAVSSGTGNAREIFAGIMKATSENRILVWSAKRAEQEILAPTRVSGALARDEGATPHVGLYLNDSTATKLEYYLHYTTDVRATACTRAGTQTLKTTTVLSSTAPKNAGSLPPSILGPGIDAKPGSMRMNLRFYAPHGGAMTDLKVNGKEQTINRGEHDGLNVVILPVLLAPGQKVTVTTSMFTGREQRNDAVFRTTPGIQSAPNNVVIPSACG